MATIDPKAAEVVRFWREVGREAWFSKDENFDSIFHGRFLDLHFSAARRELDSWIDTPEGALALLILLDQFPRNCFRGSAHMYATDPLARHFARQALAAGHDMACEVDTRLFFYLPFSHSENLADQDIAVDRGRALGEENLKHAIGHRDIVRRFGHFPHRNALLGRATSPDEQAFLDSGGFSG